jgi:hypothetical protein
VIAAAALFDEVPVMKRIRASRRSADSFATVRNVGLALPGVEATTRYDGSPVLKVDGCFMAGLATHRSAEPETLVVRMGLEEREYLLEDAPDTYYVTDYYRNYPSCWCASRDSTVTLCTICFRCRGG